MRKILKKINIKKNCTRSPTNAMLEERFNNNDSLMKTLAMNKATSRNIILTNSNDLASINNLFRSYDETSHKRMSGYNVIKEETKMFSDQFHKIRKVNNLNIKKAIGTPRFIIASDFSDLTDLYNTKGFKIPKLNPETNNFFKIDPLLEGKVNRITEGLHHGNAIVKKGVSYLNKLREAIEGNLSKNKNKQIQIGIEQSSFNKKGQFDKAIMNNALKAQYEEREQLLKETKILLDLIQFYTNIYSNNPSGESSPTNRFQNTLRYRKAEEDSLDKPISISKRISMQSMGNPMNYGTLQIEKTPLKACSSTLSLMSHVKKLNYIKIKDNQRSLSDTSCSITPAIVVSSPMEEEYEDDSECLAIAYEKALSKNFDDLNHILRFYLKKYKKCKDEDINRYLKAKKSKSQSIYERINDFQMKVQQQKLPEKITKMYLEAKKLNHISQSKIKLRSTEDKISKLNNEFLMGINPVN